MTTLVDTSVLVDYLRGDANAMSVLEQRRQEGPLHASEITRLELLAGMLPSEERATRKLLRALRWHAVDESVAETGGELGRRWLRSHSGIDSADLAVAATAINLDTDPLTTNVRHFPMFPGLGRPY